MSKYSVLPLSLKGREAYTEASKEELRVLLALIELSGRDINPDELAQIANVSRARASAAIVYWQEAGFLADGTASNLSYEFEKSTRKTGISDDGALSTAKTIRDEKLAPLITECESIMGRSMNSSETKDIVALYTQYGLDDEYIATLASYMSKSIKKLTPKSLVNRALKLVEKDILTARDLAMYIEERENESETEFAFKKLFGIYDRALSKTEKAYFAKWSKEYGYFTNIVGEAYDIAVIRTRKASLSYIDKLLSAWHEKGCKTLEECRRAIDEENEQRRRQSPKNTTKPKKERYGNFDIDDAFAKALERSYGKDD